MEKKIAILSTGGTIAMLENEKGHIQPALSSKDLIKNIPNSVNKRGIEAIEWKNQPSTYLSLSEILEISKKIVSLKNHGFKGVIITQGTDTLDETSYLLDLIFPEKNFPIVFTGAQKNPSVPGSDGVSNLIDSLITVNSSKSKDKGVLVVMNGEIHTARDVVKSHTYKLEAFVSPEFGPLGVISNKKVIWYRDIIHHETIPVKTLNARVEIVKFGLGSNSFNIENMLHCHDGIIIEALGGGHVPKKTTSGIKKAQTMGRPVVLTSRCIGRLFYDTYDFIGSEINLKQLGVIFGDALPSHKARIKLIVLLSAGLKITEIRESFENVFYK